MGSVPMHASKRFLGVTSQCNTEHTLQTLSGGIASHVIISNLTIFLRILSTMEHVHRTASCALEDSLLQRV